MKIAKKSIFPIKFEEHRYDSPNHITNHDLHSTPAFPYKTLGEVELPNDCDVVLVDEGQFFPDLSELCEKWANDGRDVYVVALSSDFMRNRWESVVELLPKCDKVHMFTAICVDCGSDASFTRKEVKGGMSMEGEGGSIDNIDIGGTDKYSPVCRKCYNNDNDDSNDTSNGNNNDER